MAVNIDITKSYVLQSIHEKAKPETMFFSDRYFTTGKSDIHTEDKILVEYKKSGERKLAHFVPERGGAIPIERDGYTVAEFGPASSDSSDTG